jgi:hypothetical protein
MTKIILDEYKTSDRFWAEAVNMVCHATNRFYLHKFLKKIPYELLTVTSQMSLILVSLKASDMFLKRGQSLLNLLLKYLKDSCLAMTQTHAHIMFSSRTPIVLKPHMKQCLMRLMAPKWSNMILML